jgi:hypothetical protein
VPLSQLRIQYSKAQQQRAYADKYDAGGLWDLIQFGHAFDVECDGSKARRIKNAADFGYAESGEAVFNGAVQNKLVPDVERVNLRFRD